MTKKSRFVLIILFALAAARDLPALVIKIGSIAPSRSPWDKALNAMAVEWEKISKGTIQVKIYPGGIVGNEHDMLRKMRLGNLGGAVLSNMGMNKINPDVFVLNTPFLMTSDEEFQFVFGKMEPLFEKQIEEKGFKVMIWTMAGWVHFFSKEKILYPEDLKKYKIGISTGEPEMEQAWKKMGYQIVPTDMKDLMMALQSGMVSVCYLPPLVAGSGQYFALTPHMLSLRVSPLVGGLVITDKIWSSIPEEYREPMIQATEKAVANLYQTSSDLEKDALITMKEHGLIIHEAPPDALEKWRAASNKGTDELIGETFSKEVYEQVISYLQEFRKTWQIKN